MQVSFYIVALMALLQSGCSKKSTGGGGTPPVTPPKNEVDCWITKGDQTSLLQKQTSVISFTGTANNFPVIDVQPETVYQTVDGFGYTLTGGSATLINHLSASEKTALLQELFGSSESSIGVSYLRISIGASDLSASVFSYNDLPAGQTDVNLSNFNLSQDTVDLIPVLKEILAINPTIKILGSPWSAPVWMKDNGGSVGGSLMPQYYSAYAKYFVMYLQQMKARGINIDAVTVQNEPLHGGNNPSMVMTATQQADFVKNHLGPALRNAGLSTKIIVWDHNCDNPNYPITILNDGDANPFVDGSAFHLYGGDISALSTVKAAYPNKNLYFTEQWTGKNGTFSGDLRWHEKNVIIGSMRNWSKNALEWNLANDPNYGPHTNGGCTECKGALTIGSTVISRNVSYYIVAHASKFVPAGSVRIASNIAGNFYNAAFLTPNGKIVLLVVNDSDLGGNFNIRYNGKLAAVSLPGGAVATYVWQ
ncbi:MAG: glycoside hydrolase family 30 beta sandwich domain-containing protein [Chitinophagaceae bacterium]